MKLFLICIIVNKYIHHVKYFFDINNDVSMSKY